MNQRGDRYDSVHRHTAATRDVSASASTDSPWMYSRSIGFGPVVVWDHLAVDEQDACEAQGTIVVSIPVSIDDCRARPGRNFSASMILERLAGLSAPPGLLLLDKFEELST